MVDPTRLRPHELDLLEDALEDLEREGVPPSLLEGHPEVAGTLAHYRELLLSSRDVLDELPPPHVLDHVFAVAAGALEDVDAGAPVETAVAAPQPRSWWKRWNAALWVPGLALAGSAALVLVIVRPTAEDATVARAEPQASTATVDRAVAGPEAMNDRQVDPGADLKGELEERSEAAPAEGDAFGTFEQRTAPAHDADRTGPAFAPLPEPPAEVPPAQGTIKYDEAARGRGDAGRIGASKGSAPPSPKPAAKAKDLPSADLPASVEPTTETKGGAHDKKLGRADALRESGRCSDAEPIYRDVDQGSASDADRARAINGLGLCARAQGRESEAETLLRQAAELAQ